MYNKISLISLADKLKVTIVEVKDICRNNNIKYKFVGRIQDILISSNKIKLIKENI